MNLLTPIVMFGWIPIVLGLFAYLPPRRAVIIAFLAAWLFLPMATYKVPGITAYTKMTATCAGIMLAAAIFDGGRLLEFHPCWADLPMVVWCLCPFATSISNGLGPKDGASAVVYFTIAWGLPYFIGRVYFSDLEGIRELAIGIFIGGLVYMPLCLYEIKMSPQLHRFLYGYFQHEFGQTKRFGGWRPMVFMQHGLMVGMWMATASLTGVWLWATNVLKRVGPVSTGWLVIAMLATTILCKSSGAVGLLAAGLAALFFARWFKRSLLLRCLILAAPLYMGFRTVGGWTGDNLVLMATDILGKDRAQSLAFRIQNEDILIVKALQRPLLGWGAWGRARVRDENGEDISTVDGLWIFALGEHGLVGLSSLTLALLLPVMLLLRRYPIEFWSSPALAGAAALATLLPLYMIDNVLNAMTNPIFALAAGAVAGLASAPAPVVPAGSASRGAKARVGSPPQRSFQPQAAPRFPIKPQAKPWT